MREVAQASGGAFLDPFALQGESGGMVRWYCAAPRLASPDLIHLTDAGYRHLARALADAIAAPPVR
jgi:lysophospholipase L1-like esterase